MMTASKETTVDVVAEEAEVGEEEAAVGPEVAQPLAGEAATTPAPPHPTTTRHPRFPPLNATPTTSLISISISLRRQKAQPGLIFSPIK